MPLTPALTPASAARTRDMATAALVAALLCAAAYLVIPLQPVPVTLQTLAVMLAALLLPAEWAAASVLVYLALGVVGIPVFASGQGGIGVLVGPTGGYLFGFLLAAGFGAGVRHTLNRRGVAGMAADVVALVLVVVVVYALGVTQLALVAGLSPLQAFAAGALPFLLGDAAKAAAAVTVAVAVRRARP